MWQVVSIWYIQMCRIIYGRVHKQSGMRIFSWFGQEKTVFQHSPAMEYGRTLRVLVLLGGPDLRILACNDRATTQTTKSG